ncbi:acetylcholinesterase-1-like [Brevipalpus obovatus]|uniref:acetylcholinesterase-1-like n=1 Tax=Brevipalpus obovatus TaxID=246614 RepID=UPI003D9F3D83
MSLLFTILILSGPLLTVFQVSRAGGVSSTPVVETLNGPIAGMVKNVNGKDLNLFLGIPYAKPPVGELRLQRPRPADHWTDVLQAVKLPPRCMQPRLSLQYIRPEMSEDCLYLNIITPQNSLQEKSPRYPVMISIFHDDHVEESGNDEIFLKSELVKRQNIILVALNSRLNFFGYAKTNSKDEIEGNYGLWDENLAIRWVKNNVKFFGGDPDRMTLRGQGSGAVNVRAHILSPHTRGYFQNAIVEGQPFTILGEDRTPRVTNSTQIVLNRIGCSTSKNRISCVQDVDAADIISALPLRWNAFPPYHDPDYVPKADSDEDQISQANDVNLLQGFPNDFSSNPISIMWPKAYAKTDLSYQDALDVIGSLVKPDDVSKIAKIYIGDGSKPLTIKELQRGLVRFFNQIVPCRLYYENYLTAEAVNKKKGVYSFQFNHIPQTNDYQVADVDREFGVYYKAQQSFIFGEPYSNYWYHSDEDRRMSDIMMSVIGSFMRKSKPELLNGKEWPNWNDPQSKKANIATVILDAESGGIIDKSNPQFCLDNQEVVAQSLITPKFHPFDLRQEEFQHKVDEKSSFQGFLYHTIRKLYFIDY